MLTFSLRRFAPCCEISLLPPCSDRFAYRSELVVCLCKQQLLLICMLAPSLGLWPSATLMSWNPHPLQSKLIDVCLRKHQWHCSVLGFQLNSMCLINNNCMKMYPRTPTAKSPSQNSNKKFQQKIPTKNSNKKFQQEIQTYWKMVS